MADPIVWPFEAHSGEQLVEEYGYATTVHRAYSGKEQRVRKRKHPTGSLEFAFVLADEWEAQRINALVNRHQFRRWACPLWQYAQPLTGSVSMGSMSIPVVTTNVPFQDLEDLGPYVLIWRGTRSWELLKISSVDPTQINLIVGAASAWAQVGTFAIPIRVSRLAGPLGFRWLTSGAIGGRVKFEFDGYEATTSTGSESDWVQFGDFFMPAGAEGEP